MQTTMSRQERRALERATAKGKMTARIAGEAIPEATVRRDWDSTSREEEALAIESDLKSINAPRGLPNIKQNTRLNVLKCFLTTEACPHGAGLKCYEVDKGLRAIAIPGKGYAWLSR